MFRKLPCTLPGVDTKATAWAESGASRCPSLGVCVGRVVVFRLRAGVAVPFYIAVTAAFCCSSV